MKIQVELIGDSSREDVFDLKNYIEEEGINTRLLFGEKDGTLGGDYTSILEIVAQSATLVAIINGIFSCVKNYMMIKSNDRKVDVESNMIKISYKINDELIDVLVNKKNVGDIDDILNQFVNTINNKSKTDS